MACTWAEPTTEAEAPAMLLRHNVLDKLRAEGMAIALKEQPREAYVPIRNKTFSSAEPLPQAQCLLFQKLPPELRLRIWQTVFEAPCIRLERWRPIHILEQIGDSRDALDADCFPYRLAMAGHSPNQHLLTLLFSCRRVYCEASPILYSAHKFIFTDVRDLLSFQETTPPTHLNSIRNLTIIYETVDRVPDFFIAVTSIANVLDSWNRVFHRLRTMSLTRLHIWLYRIHEDFQGPHLPWLTTATQGWTDKLEEHHRSFFAVLNRVQVDEYQVHLNWCPNDLFVEGQWSFTPRLASSREIRQMISGLPRPAYEGLYD